MSDTITTRTWKEVRRATEISYWRTLLAEEPNFTKAAKIADVHRTWLYARLHTLGLEDLITKEKEYGNEQWRALASEAR